MSDDIINQDEIDALFNSPDPDDKKADAEEQEKEENQSTSSDLISQDDIDNLFEDTLSQGASDASSSAAAQEPEKESPSPSLLDQNDIDSLFDDVLPSSKEAKDTSGSSDMTSQDDIDNLIAGIESGEIDLGIPSSSSKNEEPAPVLTKSEPEKPKAAAVENKILSQGDIDALLDSIGTMSGDTEEGEKTGSSGARVNIESITGKSLSIPAEFAPILTAKSTDKKYRLYDFRRPEKLSRDQIRKIKNYFEALPRQLTNYFAQLLRSRVEVKHIDIDQRNYGDMFKATSTPIIYGVFSLGHSAPTGIMEFSTHLFYNILERLVGGSGMGISQIRPITDFERYLVADLFNQILGFYRDMFSKLAPIEPQIELIENDSQLIPKTLSENDVLVRTVYELKINGMSGYMNISIPYSFIGPYFTKYSSHEVMETEQSPSAKNNIGKSFGKLLIPVSVEFNKKKIKASDAVSLSPGMMLMLDHPESRELAVRVNGKLKFFGLPGMKGNKVAVKITSTIEDEV